MADDPACDEPPRLWGWSVFAGAAVIAADTHVGRRFVRIWWTSRLALLVADTLLLAASAIAALAGASVAAMLIQAFILVTMLSATIIMGAQCAINVLRAARGPAGAES